MVQLLRLGILVPAFLLCAAPPAAAKRKSEEDVSQEVKEVKKLWQQKDNSFNSTLKKAHAYAIFPEVGKGGFLARYDARFAQNIPERDTRQVFQVLRAYRLLEDLVADVGAAG